MAYPRSLMKEIFESVNQDLKDIYINMGGVRFFGSETLEEIAVESLEHVLHGTTDSIVIRKTHSTVIAQMNRKKKRWAASAVSVMDQYPLSDQRHPFHYLQMQRDSLPQSEFRMLYGSLSEKKILESKREQLITWAGDRASLFTNYPAFGSLTTNKKMAAFKDDLVLEELRILETKFCYEIKGYLSSYIDEMGKRPIFQAKAKRHKASAGEISEIVQVESDLGSETMELVLQGTAMHDISDNIITMPQEKEMRLLMHIINQTQYQPLNADHISIPLVELVHVLYPNQTASSSSYKMTERRLKTLANFTCNSYDRNGNWLAGYNFIEHIAIQKSTARGDRTVDIALGNTLKNAVLQKRVRSFKQSDYTKLDTPMARIMFISLQQERIATHLRYMKSKTNPPYKTIINYRTLQSWISFPQSMQKRARIRTIKQILSEYVNANVILKDFVHDTMSDDFQFTFIDLTEDELRDMLGADYNKEVLSVASN